MIREMTEQDIPRMIELGARMHLESEYKDFNYSTQKTYKLGHTIIDSNDMCGFVSEVDGEIKGMFIGAKWEHYFSDATISGDLLLYVDPDHRGGMTGIRLIKAYLSWAKGLGVDDIRLGETAGIDREAIAKLYAKLGFINYGTIYKLNR
jgi:GNAT superfamily N-acetyltransferase